MSVGACATLHLVSIRSNSTSPRLKNRFTVSAVVSNSSGTMAVMDEFNQPGRRHRYFRCGTESLRLEPGRPAIREKYGRDTHKTPSSSPVGLSAVRFVLGLQCAAAAPALRRMIGMITAVNWDLLGLCHAPLAQVRPCRNNADRRPLRPGGLDQDVLLIGRRIRTERRGWNTRTAESAATMAERDVDFDNRRRHADGTSVSARRCDRRPSVEPNSRPPRHSGDDYRFLGLITSYNSPTPPAGDRADAWQTDRRLFLATLIATSSVGRSHGRQTVGIRVGFQRFPTLSPERSPPDTQECRKTFT